EAEAPIDLAFAALWFSHVPSERLLPMLATLRRAVRPGGQLCIIDELDTSPARPPTTQDPQLELRELRNGRQFQIVKVYRSPQHLAALCMEAGFMQVTDIAGTYFFGLIAQ
ncbi:MAG TPA: class I SAM-dependent methyltransferase, partial [Ktedonobacterales bacterium]|nr:class I SAM-dependent methyltransferase [Ktedonobacterales bacterium]